MSSFTTSIELDNLHSSSHSCKFCLDDISLSSKNSYIIPCKCKGSIEYIHINCLLKFFSYYKTTKCSLCQSTFSFIRWYHYVFSHSLSFFTYIFLFYFYFNLQLLFLWSVNYPSHTYQQLILFKLSRYYFLALDFWVTGLILIVVNLILNNGPQLHILDIKTLSTLPLLSLELTSKTILFKLVNFYLIHL